MFRIIYHQFMNKTSHRDSLPFDSPAPYQIVVQGRIDATWSDCLEGMKICRAAEILDSPVTTSLEGELSDQAALAGVLNTLYELHLPVISVKRMSVEQSRTNNYDNTLDEKQTGRTP
jgi:hypothetical protein